jgi:hypothetical protein
MQTAVNGGSKLLIFDRRTASDHATMSQRSTTETMNLMQRLRSQEVEAAHAT